MALPRSHMYQTTVNEGWLWPRLVWLLLALYCAAHSLFLGLDNPVHRYQFSHNCSGPGAQRAPLHSPTVVPACAGMFRLVAWSIAMLGPCCWRRRSDGVGRYWRRLASSTRRLSSFLAARQSSEYPCDPDTAGACISSYESPSWSWLCSSASRVS